MTAKKIGIRLSQEESNNLTMIRAAHEIKTGERTAIKKLIKYLIGAARLDVNLNKIPIEKSTPSVKRNGHFEYIAFEKSEDDENTLNELLRSGPFGLKINYGQADLIRELIKIEAEKINRESLQKKQFFKQ